MGKISRPSRAAAGAEQKPDRIENDKVVFFDDFSAGVLDRDAWNVEGPDFWVNNEQQAYIDSPETISLLPPGAVDGATGGVLELRARHRPGFTTPDKRTTDFVSGRINTRDKVEVTYGRIAARMRMPAMAGIWPAFWMLGQGDWPQTGEIDIMEYVGEPDWTGVALHGKGYSGDTPLVNKYFFTPETDATDWHVYAVDWNADRIVFTIDGRTIYRVTRPMVELYGPWPFDAPKFIILNLALGGEYPYKTNRVEGPYYGLPAHAVETIRKDGVAIQIDWVRVTQSEGANE